MDVTLIEEYKNNNKYSKVYIDKFGKYFVVAVNDAGTGFRSTFENLEQSINFAKQWVIE